MYFPGQIHNVSLTVFVLLVTLISNDKIYSSAMPRRKDRLPTSNQSILREINLEYSLEGLTLELKFQYFGHLIPTDNSLVKPLMLGKIEGRRRGGCRDEMAGQHHRCNEYELGQTLGDGEGQGGLACCSPWGCKELDTIGRLNNSHNQEGRWLDGG